MPILKKHESGALTFIPRPTPEKFLYTTTKHTLIAGGVRAGKTVALCYKALLLSRMYDNNVGMICRLDYPQLRDTTMKTFFMLLRELGWKWTFNKTEHDLSLPNGSMIMFRHLKDYEPKMGMELSWLAIDQIEQTPEDAFRLLTTRLNHVPEYTKDEQFQQLLEWYGKHWRMISFSTANPAGHNWVWRRWKQNEELKKVGSSKYNPRYELFDVTTDENAENLPEGYIEDTFVDLPDHLERVYRFGSWEEFEQSIYTTLFIPDYYVIDPLYPSNPFPKNATFYRAYDHGGLAHPACCLWFYIAPSPYDEQMEAVIFDEYYMEGLTPDAHAANILSRWQGIDIFLTYGDPTSMRMRHYTPDGGTTPQAANAKEEYLSMMQIYQDAGLTITPAFRPVHPGITRVQRWMKVIKGRKHRFNDKLQDSAPHLYITRNCSHLLEEIMEYHMSSERPGAVVDKKNDAVDAMRFGLASDLINEWTDVVQKPDTIGYMEESIERMFEAMGNNEEPRFIDMPSYFCAED